MKIFIHTETNPEDNAMLQALYSRSSASVVDHIEKLREVGSGEFMSRYYLGYGHKSIADCGFSTVYLEGISMLAAKAVEDHPLYNGQEVSTRYLDFSTKKFINPVEGFDIGGDTLAKIIAFSSSIHESLRSFYLESMDPVVAHLKEKFPLEEGQKESVYDKAIKARAFDILRGWLPAGATTNVAVTMSLRNLEEHFSRLIFHPLTEVSQMAWTAYEKLRAQFPNSFQDRFAVMAKVVDEGYDPLDLRSDIWVSNLMKNFQQEYLYYIGLGKYSFYNNPDDYDVMISEDPFVELISVYPDQSDIRATQAAPRHAPIPRHAFPFKDRVTVEGLLDFGSFRDIQRHRAGYCSMFPLNTLFNKSSRLIPDFSWYKNQLPEEVRAKAEKLDLDLFQRLTLLKEECSLLEDLDMSYFIPMKSTVPVILDYDVEQARYVAELRSGKTVHSTLRPLAQKIGEVLVNGGYRCDYDSSLDNWTIRRGEQDIVEK